MEDINVDKHRQRKKDNEKLENKRGISLCNKISKLFEKIIVNRLNKHLNFIEACYSKTTEEHIKQFTHTKINHPTKKT